MSAVLVILVTELTPSEGEGREGMEKRVLGHSLAVGTCEVLARQVADPALGHPPFEQ